MKKCPFCAEEIQDDAKICRWCRSDLTTATPGGQTTSPGPLFGPTAVLDQGGSRTSGKAIGSLGLGLFFVAFPAAIAAVILGHLAKTDIRKSSGTLKGDGLATAGLVLGYIGVALIPIAIISGIAVPSLLRARGSADEAAAIGALRTINSAQAAFSSSCGNGFYAPSLGVLSAPPPGSASGFLSSDLGSDPVVKSRYRIFLVPGPSAASSPASCNGTLPGALVETYFTGAEPLEAGRRYFSSSMTGTIYQSGSPISPTQTGAPSGATPVQ